MTLKPPTRTFPKLVMKEWPEKDSRMQRRAYRTAMDEIRACTRLLMRDRRYHKLLLMRKIIEEYGRDKALSDFTRVLEGVEGQKRPQKEKSRDE